MNRLAFLPLCPPLPPLTQTPLDRHPPPQEATEEEKAAARDTALRAVVEREVANPASKMAKLRWQLAPHDDKSGNPFKMSNHPDPINMLDGGRTSGGIRSNRMPHSRPSLQAMTSAVEVIMLENSPTSSLPIATNALLVGSVLAEQVLLHPQSLQHMGAASDLCWQLPEGTIVAWRQPGGKHGWRSGHILNFNSTTREHVVAVRTNAAKVRRQRHLAEDLHLLMASSRRRSLRLDLRGQERNLHGFVLEGLSLGRGCCVEWEVTASLIPPRQHNGGGRGGRGGHGRATLSSDGMEIYTFHFDGGDDHADNSVTTSGYHLLSKGASGERVLAAAYEHGAGGELHVASDGMWLASASIGSSYFRVHVSETLDGPLHFGLHSVSELLGRITTIEEADRVQYLAANCWYNVCAILAFALDS